MQIQIAGIVEESIVDGLGIRMAIFTQGCCHHCPGCHNPNTHDASAGRTDTTERIIDAMHHNRLIDGITLTGGEPFMQPEACTRIANAAHEAGLNVWAYTGYTFEQLLEDDEKSRLLRAVDVLVDGSFLLAQRSLELHFRGSKNQRIIDVPRSLAEGKVITIE